MTFVTCTSDIVTFSQVWGEMPVRGSSHRQQCQAADRYQRSRVSARRRARGLASRVFPSSSFLSVHVVPFRTESPAHAGPMRAVCCLSLYLLHRSACARVVVMFCVLQRDVICVAVLLYQWAAAGPRYCLCALCTW